MKYNHCPVCGYRTRLLWKLHLHRRHEHVAVWTAAQIKRVASDADMVKSKMRALPTAE